MKRGLSYPLFLGTLIPKINIGTNSRTLKRSLYVNVE